jgi:hypothetical protein
MYAIVDIETTGGHASANGITEVAICIHDGMQVTHRYETLINPGMRDSCLYPVRLRGSAMKWCRMHRRLSRWRIKFISCCTIKFLWLTTSILIIHFYATI